MASRCASSCSRPARPRRLPALRRPQAGRRPRGESEGTILSGVEPQRDEYADGLPDDLAVPIEPLPFAYQSTGVETRFTNTLDPDPRSRECSGSTGPRRSPRWIAEVRRRPDDADAAPPAPHAAASSTRPVSGRRRSTRSRTWRSRSPQDRPRALIQMATGSGQDLHGRERRLPADQVRRRATRAVPRRPREPRPPDAEGVPGLHDARTMGASSPSSTTSSTCARTRSTRSRVSRSRRSSGSTRCCAASRARPRARRAVRLRRCADRAGRRSSTTRRVPPETFDVVIVDECHRSIFGVWRQVLDYFDAFIDRPDRDAEQAGVRVLQPEPRDGVHATSRRSPTRSTSTSTSTGSAPRSPSGAAPSTPGSSPSSATARRASARWEKLDEDVSYGAEALDRAVVAEDQIRTVHRDVPRPALHRDLPRPQRGPEDADLRQGRRARRRHRPDRPRGVRQGQRVRRQDHLQGDRPQARGADRRRSATPTTRGSR